MKNRAREALRQLFNLADNAAENAQTGEITLDGDDWNRMLLVFWNYGGWFRDELKAYNWSPPGRQEPEDDGPGEEDGPWAEGWAERSRDAGCTCPILTVNHDVACSQYSPPVRSHQRRQPFHSTHCVCADCEKDKCTGVDGTCPIHALHGFFA